MSLDRARYATQTLEQFVTHSRSLLQQERDAEIEQALQLLEKADEEHVAAAGVSLPRLLVTDTSAGLFGRTLLTLADVLGRSLTAHNFTVGDIAGIRSSNSSATASSGKRASEEKGGAGASAAINLRSNYDVTGVVTRVSDTAIELALDEKASDAAAGSAAASATVPEVGDKVRLDRLADDVTFKRLRDVLDALGKGEVGSAARVVRLLFGNEGGEWPRSAATPRFSPTVAGLLNDSQTAAIQAALDAEDVALIHGPPGTGKTTTVVEYIRHEVTRGRKVLACAPSNVAVDNLLERLARPSGSSRVKCVRLGHPARITPAALAHSLDALLEGDERSGIVAGVRRELSGVYRSLRDCRDKAQRRELRGEQRRLQQEVRRREEALVASIIRDADVILTTNTGAATRVLRKALTSAPPGVAIGLVGGGGGSGAGGGGSVVSGGPSVFRGFDVAVVDEVAQALELSVLIPALQAGKLVVAGDHMQLPPTVVSEAAAAQGLAYTLADRCVDLFGDPAAALQRAAAAVATTTSAARGPGGGVAASDLPPVVHLLDTQYRMHATIMGWSSGRFYGGKLKADASVAAHRLSHLPHVRLTPADGATTVPAALLREIHGAAKDVAEESLREERRGAGKAGRREGGDEAGGGGSSGGAGAGAGPGKPAGGPVGKRGGADAGKRPHASLDPLTARAVAVQSTLADAGSDFSVDNECLDAPLLLIDTAGCDVDETVDAVTSSKANVGEADIVVRHVAALLTAGLRPEEVAVITPYNAQVGLIRALLASAFPRVEVRSVDGFQGQEKAAVVISMVRSNRGREVGFLRDFRRMNVAVTRAKRHVALVADSDTVKADPHLRSLIAYAEGSGEVRSAVDYLSAGDAVAAAIVAMGPAAGAGAGAAGASVAAPAADSVGKAAGGGRVISDEDRRASVRKTLRTFMHKVDAHAARCAATAAAAVTAAADAAAAPAGSGPAAAAGAGAAAAETGAAPAPAATNPWPLSLSVPVGNMSRRGALAAAHLAAPGGVASCAFPASLTSFERMLVHEVATELGLEHASESLEPGAAASTSGAEGSAEGADAARATSPAAAAGDAAAASAVAPRRVVVRYVPKALVASVLPVTAGEAAPAAAATGGKPSSKTSGKAGSGGAASAAPVAAAIAAGPPAPSVIQSEYVGSNALLRALHEKRMAAAAATDAAAGAEGAAKKVAVDAGAPSIVAGAKAPAAAAAGAAGAGGGGKVGGKPGGKAGKKGASAGPGASGAGGASGAAAAIPDLDDEDALLDAMLERGKRCAFERCKRPTHATGTTCRHCNLRFCYEHGLPEEHGCGDAVRAAARQTWSAAGGSAALGGTAGAGKKVDDWKHRALARQLHKKIDDAAAERAPAAAKKGEAGKGGKK